MLQWHSKLFDCIIAYMYKPNKQTFSSFFCIFWKNTNLPVGSNIIPNHDGDNVWQRHFDCLLVTMWCCCTINHFGGIANRFRSLTSYKDVELQRCWRSYQIKINIATPCLNFLGQIFPMSSSPKSQAHEHHIGLDPLLLRRFPHL
jgi:hypothetical protein